MPTLYDNKGTSIDSNQPASVRIDSVLYMANGQATHNETEMAGIGKGGHKLLRTHVFDDYRFQFNGFDDWEIHGA